VIELAERNDAVLPQASTSEVYPDPMTQQHSEQSAGWVRTPGPRACDDDSKRCAETFATEYARRRALPVRISPAFTTKGRRMRPNHRWARATCLAAIRADGSSKSAEQRSARTC
jgi:UDP-glucuronate decarboxylase